jgi:hypothetical protein
MTTVISIIGSAGRGADGNLMSAIRFNAMVDTVETMIVTAKYEWKNIELRSGGAAWCDHIAVALFLRHKESKLVIFAPCDWNVVTHVDEAKGVITTSANFYDSGSGDWRVNPGKLANKYHAEFSQKMGYNTLQQIEEARQAGATIDCSCKGFHKRNLQVAKCNMLLAFTSSDGDAPHSTGGTHHTWSSCTAWKAHLPLRSMPF